MGTLWFIGVQAKSTVFSGVQATAFVFYHQVYSRVYAMYMYVKMHKCDSQIYSGVCRLRVQK